jgi:hypothetical protein
MENINSAATIDKVQLGLIDKIFGKIFCNAYFCYLYSI